MARKRREYMTGIDYVVIALSPALIMTLVGSLCFFLLDVFYRGQYEARLTWIMSCFVFAIVLIARISMEEGAERAGVYGLALAGAVGVAMFRFVDSPFVVWGLMGLTWWCANKLTWDCTLVDDDQDASGEGLLQIVGFDDSLASAGESASAGEPARSAGEPEASASGSHRGANAPRSPRDSAKGFWQRLLESPEERRRRPHAPGVWVVYFSLAALPLFGLGQALIPAGDLVRRRYAFALLAAYVASGLGLLLTTSFLGLRRYLRQRRLQMPLAMTGVWLSVGAVLIAALLLAAQVIPRPNPEYPVEELIAGALGSHRRDASRHAILKDSATQGAKDGASGRESAEQQNQQGQGQQGQGQQGQGQQGQGQQGQGQQNAERGTRNAERGTQNAEQQSQRMQGQQDQQNAERGTRNGEQGRSGQSSQSRERTAEQQSGQSMPSESRSPEAQSKAARSNDAQPAETPQPSRLPDFTSVPLAAWIRWAMYAAMLAAALYGFLKYRKRVLAFVRQLWEELKNILNGLFGRRPAAAREAAVEAAPPPRPFAAFEDPFLTGAAGRTSPEQLVRYSFDALQAWASERGFPRTLDATPLEFSQQLAGQAPQIGSEAQQLAQLYSQVAYARRTLSPDCLPMLRQLWERLRATSRPAAAARSL